MHHHRRGKHLRAHMTFDEKPIKASAICCCCEDQPDRRIDSWNRAMERADYDQASRATITEGRCAFCGLKLAGG